MSPRPLTGTETMASAERDTIPATPEHRRLAGSIAIGAGLVGIALSPLMNAAYHLTAEGAPESRVAWELTLRENAGAVLSFAAPTTVYNVYGRAGFVVFAGLLAGLLALRASRSTRRTEDHTSGRLEWWGFRTAFVGLGLNLLGNVGDYWLGRPEWLDTVAFLVGTLLGLLVLVVGLALLGVVGWQTRTHSRLLAGAFLLWLPAALALSVVGLDNIPGGAFVPLGVVAVVLGLELRHDAAVRPGTAG